MSPDLVSTPSRRRSVAAAFAVAAMASCALPAWAAAPNVEGRWTDVIAWPRIPVHMALLPDGKVATFGATPQSDQGGLDVDIWAPSLGTGNDSHVTLPNGINVDTFCAGVVLASWSGELIAVGGATEDASSTLKTSRFSYKTRALAAAEGVKYPRWYSTTTTLPDGRIIVNGGVKPYGNSADASTMAELYTPGQGWRVLTGTDQARQDASDIERRYWYPHVFPTTNNKVFVIAGKTMYQLGYDGNGSVGNFQAFKGTNWGGTSTAVLFQPKKVIQFGGGRTFNEDTSAPAGSKRATVIDFSTYPYKVRDTGSMAFGRHWVTGTLLPNGEVLATGGAEGNNQLTNVAYAAEIWNPGTGRWRTGAAMKVPRLYHSSALLLPDGRVLSGGGGAPGPVNGNNVEIYSPPYLFAADGSPAARPTITTEPGTVRLGQAVRIQAGGQRPIVRFTMLKTGAVTHGFNTDQRFLDVPFTKSGDAYQITITSDAVDATPGYWLLFAIDDAGVPSVAKMMRIPSPTADNGDTPPAGQTSETAGIGPTASTGGNTSSTGGATGGGTATTPADGTAGPLIAAHSNMCLSIEGGSGADGARAIQETCNGSAIQKWTWKAANGGSLLVNAKTDKCLDLFEFQTDDGAAVIQWGCKSTDNQIWTARQGVDGGLTLASKHTGKCVDVFQVSTQSGAQVGQWTCNGQANQSWKVSAPTASGTNGGDGAQIGNEAVKVASAADGTTLVINSRTGIVWRSNTGNGWDALGNRAMREVATGGSGKIYAIGTDAGVYRWNGSDWIFIGPNARTIAAASDGTVVVTNPANEVWVKAADNFERSWNRIGGSAQKVVAIAANRFWSIGLDGNVYRSSGNGQWGQMGVNVSDIAVSSDGGVAVINKDTGETWRKATEDADWTRPGGTALQVSAQTSGLWVTVGRDGNVYRVKAN